MTPNSKIKYFLNIWQFLICNMKSQGKCSEIGHRLTQFKVSLIHFDKINVPNLSLHVLIMPRPDCTGLLA